MHSSELRAVTLSPPSPFLFIPREGFDAGEVDVFLGRCADALESYENGGRPAFESDEIIVKQFRHARFGRIYDPDEVDDLLDRVAEQIRAHQIAAGDAD